MTATRTIAVLPPDVADQIAAGEVVERPASVVKELVENALDAGARAIDIAIADGGRVSIRVSDDGGGMTPDDAVLAIERHATSKIRSSADLVGVASFGFRGEALPAIGSVAHLEIETATHDGAGTRVRVVGGRLEGVSPAARRRGTAVTVEGLFFNTPARLKFLRGTRSEWRAISEVLTTVALVRRDVRITATHDNRAMIQLPPATSLRERVAALWGVAVAEMFVAVDDVSGPVRVAGLAQRPADVGLSARRIFVSVNGRAVRDAGMIRAAEAAYRSTVPSGVRPSLLLEITAPAADVDVNVHPAKAEVRFRDRWNTERAVERAVRRALGTSESTAAFGQRAAFNRVFAPQDVDVEQLRSAAWNDDTLMGGASPNPVAAGASSDAPHRGLSPSTSPDPESVVDIPPLWQLRRTWMAFEREGALVLIDQHSAHERVLFERFVKDMTDGRVSSQQLLFPLTLHLSPAEADACDASRDVLERLGFEIESFGAQSILVRAVPSPHPRFDAERCLRETLAAFVGDRGASALPRHERLAATVACKAAIKAGDTMAQAEMRALFGALAQCTLPAHDVHGRSTIVQISWEELERRFGRR